MVLGEPVHQARADRYWTAPGDMRHDKSALTAQQLTDVEGVYLVWCMAIRTSARADQGRVDTSFVTPFPASNDHEVQPVPEFLNKRSRMLNRKAHC